MPVSAAPSSRSTRNTNASDHTAVRRVSDAMAMKTATYATLADRGGDERRHRARRASPRRPRPARPTGAIVTSATIEPPSQRPSTICHVGVGESHVKWNVPARTSAPSTESPMIERGDRHHEPEDAVGGDVRERALVGGRRRA